MSAAVEQETSLLEAARARRGALVREAEQEREAEWQEAEKVARECADELFSMRTGRVLDMGTPLTVTRRSDAEAPYCEVTFTYDGLAFRVRPDFDEGYPRWRRSYPHQGERETVGTLYVTKPETAREFAVWDLDDVARIVDTPLEQLLPQPLALPAGRPRQTPQERARQSFDRAVAAMESAAQHLADAQNDESALEDERAAVKEQAIRRLMQITNELTGKPHSASSAKDVVELDEGYRAHRARQREAVIVTQRAWARWEAVKARVLAAESYLAAVLQAAAKAGDALGDDIIADYEIVES